VIHLRHSSPRFPEEFIAEAIGDSWEPRMRRADQILEDEKLVHIVYEALLRRHPKSRVMRQAKRFSGEIASGVKRSPDVLKQAALEGLKREIDSMTETLGKVAAQTKARVFGGDTHVAGKILSVFETSTEVIRKGKASKPTEFGKMVKF
jgi:hypothetical protein